MTAPNGEKQRLAAMLNMNQLRARGWTGTMVRRLLGGPDRTKKNPAFPRAVPVKYYDPVRVAAAEATDEFKLRHTRAASRAANVKKAVEAEHSALREAVAKMNVAVRPIDKKRLLKLALQHRQTQNAQVGSQYTGRFWEPTTVLSNTTNLASFQVNYIRHHLVEYDRTLEELTKARRTPDQVALRAIRAKIYNAIADVYPEFASECARQLDQVDEARSFEVHATKTRYATV